MNRYITKTISILKYASFLASVMPFCIATLCVFFMADTIPIHFDRDWVVDGYGSNLTTVLEGFILTLTALILPIAFERVRIAEYGRLIGFIGSLVLSLIYICIQIYGIAKAFEISGVYGLTKGQEITSFVCSIIGVCLLLLGSIVYFVLGDTAKFNLKNMIIAITFSIVGGLESFLSLIVKNYFAILILCVGVILCVIITILANQKRLFVSKSV